jgi:hypothetical protein
VNGLSGNGQLLFAGSVTLGVLAFYGIQRLWKRFHTAPQGNRASRYLLADDDPIGDCESAIAASTGLDG